MTQRRNDEMTLYLSNVRCNASNTSYPEEAKISCVEDLRRATRVDHTSGKFAAVLRGGKTIEGYRSIRTFISADNIAMDCDNVEKDPSLPDISPELWETPETIRKKLPNVAFYAVPSRNHMKAKDGMSPRPKWHYYFPLQETITVADEVRDLKTALQQHVPAFDSNALDAARFFFGVGEPEPVFIEGELCIDEFMRKEGLFPTNGIGLQQCDGKDDASGIKPKDDASGIKPKDDASGAKPKRSNPKKYPDVIPVGQRNATLSRFAAAVLKKYGIDDGMARKAFVSYSSQCEQPLPESELSAIWESAERYFREAIATNPDYIDPQTFRALKSTTSLEPRDYTDVGQARVFVAKYGNRIRYSEATKWLIYDGTRWVESELRAQKLAQDLTDDQLREAQKKIQSARDREDAAVESGDRDEKTTARTALRSAERYRDFVLDRRRSNAICATLKEARPAVEIGIEELDKDGFKLNTPKGTVTLNDGVMHPHNPEDGCTRITAVAPSQAGAQIWGSFLQTLTCGDKDLQRYLQITSGMEAVGGVFVEKLTIAYGHGGNGKSTFYNLKARVLGDYSGTLSSETLTANCRKNKSHEFAELRGKRLVIASELEEGMRLDTSAVKKLCSTDPVQAEKKFKDPFSFRPSHSTVLYTNHLPKVGTNDAGTWDRLVVIPFNARFRDTEGEVMNYAEFLFDHCGGAVLSWIIEGAQKFIAAQFHIEQPECVKRAIAEYQDDNNWTRDFVDECCEEAPNLRARAQDLYSEYRRFCDTKHEWARGAGDFKAALTAAGYSWKKTKQGAFYYGLSLKSDASF